MIDVEASTRLMASTARVIMRSEPPAPPYDSGTSIPIRPSSKSLGMRSASSFAA
jgi:hypothetical protein